MHPDLLFPEPLSDYHDISKISAGDVDAEGLVTFIRDEARTAHEDDITKTFVLCFDVPEGHELKNRVVGYVSFTNSEVSFRGANKPETLNHIPYNSLPALKVTRLLVCSDYQRKGFGELLIGYATEIAEKKLVPWVGCRLLVVDSKQKAIDFYLKCGFDKLNTKKNLAKSTPVMYRDLRFIRSDDGERVAISEQQYSIPETQDQN